ncbi:MAG TPA: DUF1360 domain-containing protein [Chitinophagaceae bacterium]|jgi:hypothetical protein|nr:DUF1360 domain-containing protein [Chitinophagaceae bacterium]
MNWFYFIASSLSVWRLSHLFSKEDGPFDLVYLLRKKAGAGFFGSLLDCFYCVSVWTALPFGIWLGNTWWEKLFYWVALSGAACLLERATDHKKHDNSKTFYSKN